MTKSKIKIVRGKDGMFGATKGTLILKRNMMNGKARWVNPSKVGIDDQIAWVNLGEVYEVLDDAGTPIMHTILA